MYRAGHLGAALLCGSPGLLSLYLLDYPLLGGVWLCALVGVASLPDIDHRLPIPHRGPTHSLAFALIASTALGAIAVGFADAVSTSMIAEGVGVSPSTVGKGTVLSIGVVATLGGFVSITSHLLADALTTGNGRYAVKPLWPVSNRPLRFGVTTADSAVWNYGLLIAGTLTCTLAFLAPSLL